MTETAPPPTEDLTDDDATADELRRGLIGLTPTLLLRLTMLMVTEALTDPVAYEVPLSGELAAELLAQCAESAAAAANAELRPADPGLSPSAQQWLHSAVLPDSPLAAVDALVTRPSHPQYDRSVEFGRKSLLVLRIRDADGRDLGRLYQAFSPEKALQRRKVWALWSGEQFVRLTEEPLVIDRGLRLIVLGDAVTSTVVMQSPTTYQSMFGALPELRKSAEKTYRASIGKLDIVDGDKLAAACQTDLNMMRKLVSIQAKLDRPGYADAVTMPALVTFLKAHPKIDVPVQDADGPHPRLVFSSDAQHRWAILKLLDDDFLRSELTDITYEANSKTQLS
ncbi:Kiwa anti-phage protein KwaB-like domain-containing protein [Nakamurella deserti]|uniref:Kiwa anti-phage protein KwaB-like domain-containing protein n=1 Tax=Nakamurella deserti TaxID=2164074 RepID=UPI000DBE577B|nr:Kiwa anti-phage protein KwaB-like domain-containing protein [Nakamurella deserti]